MKRIKYIDGKTLYEHICSRENIEEAVKKACKDHARNKSVIEIKLNPEPYIDEVQRILETESFEYSSFKTKVIFERGKERKLCFTDTFPDRIVQHAVFNVVTPILHKSIPRDEYAAIKGRGTHICGERVYRTLLNDMEGTRYCLKMDIHHFFDSISRKKLFEMIKKKIKCPKTLNILFKIIFTTPGKKGLPIGLYSSQILSVFYLSEFDHYCKETLGIKYYFRYMDDIVILSHDKNILHNIRRLVQEKLKEYKLELKRNYAVFPVEKRRIDFVGFVSNHETKMIRKSTKISYIRSCNKIIKKVKTKKPIELHDLLSMESYKGIISWSTDHGLIDKYDTKVCIALEIGGNEV